MNSGLFYRDNDRIVISAPEIIIGNVDKSGTLQGGMGKVFIKIVSHSPKKASLTLLKALDESIPTQSFIVPRGLFTISGYPKIKRFPKKRIREYLVNQLR